MLVSIIVLSFDAGLNDICHKVIRKEELVQEIAKPSVMVDLVYEMTAQKSCKYSRCGSFQYLFFLLCKMINIDFGMLPVGHNI